MKKTFIRELIELSEGKDVLISGWVHVRRTMSRLIFFDVRDSTGIIQVVFYLPDLATAIQEKVQAIKPEWVIAITGKLQKRSAKQVNPDLATGSIEIGGIDVEVLSEAETPPFEIENEERQAKEDLRLEYRYLDLRHQRMAQNLRLRHNVCQYIRNYLTDEHFIEIQTPILSKSTPEGARDYLVPSRLHKGKFFALPQSPQQYKQLLMVAGFERYFQIAPCFRDEDARADRSPGEFYQVDMEMSFMEQDEILHFVEQLFTSLVTKLFPHKTITSSPWPRLNYEDVMKKYKTDKPDLRKDKDNPDELAFAWVINFPLFVKQSDEDHFHGAGTMWAPSHHMFTAPHPDDIPFMDSDPGRVRGLQHDLVLNGFELGGGSIRIHQPVLQNKIFDLIGFTSKDKKQFEHILKAFRYGVPPHGGIAPGLDRLIMLLTGEKNIREITAFPLTTDGRDPLMDSPSTVSKAQLDDLNIQLKKK